MIRCDHVDKGQFYKHQENQKKPWSGHCQYSAQMPLDPFYRFCVHQPHPSSSMLLPPMPAPETLLWRYPLRLLEQLYPPAIKSYKCHGSGPQATIHGGGGCMKGVGKHNLFISPQIVAALGGNLRSQCSPSGSGHTTPSTCLCLKWHHYSAGSFSFSYSLTGSFCFLLLLLFFLSFLR